MLPSEVAASLPAVVLQGLESLEPVLIISLISSKLSSPKKLERFLV